MCVGKSLTGLLSVRINAVSVEELFVVTIIEKVYVHIVKKNLGKRQRNE